MATVTTWTGRDANALRHALRMSMTGFAEHLGAARRTVAKWSSQGDKVLPRADMQAALDTVLSRATPEARARFEALRTVGTSGTAAGAARRDAGGHADVGDDEDRDSDPGGEVRRRDLLREAAIGEVGDRGPALVAAERSTRAAALSQDPVAMAASARIMTHALMSNGHDDQAVTLAAKAADSLGRDTRLASADAVAVYGALVLRGASAAARRDDRDTAYAMLDGATRAAARLGYDGNDRWTGFGAVNVLLHQVNIAPALGDAGTAIAVARTVALGKVTLLATGSTRTAAVDFAQSAGIAL